MRALFVVALLSSAATPAAAQLPRILPAGHRWIDTWYPKLFYSGREGLTVGGYYAFIRPLPYSAFEDPAAYDVAITLDGQISTSGSRQLSLDFFGPSLADGWRFRLTFAGARRNREPYFGVGNILSIDGSLQNDSVPMFYRSRLSRLFARGEVQRRIVGGLRILIGFHAERVGLDSLAGPSLLGADQAAGAVPGGATGDVSARVGLVFDTRDNEVAPDRGVLLEAIHGRGDSTVAGSLTYSRTTVSARGYLPLGRITLAARVAGQTMGGAPGVGSYYLFEASDRPFEAIGGAASHRGLEEHRLLGRDKLLGNFDVRYALYELPTLLRLSLVGFFDAGRVFETEDFEITTRDMTVGAGGGLFLKMFRAGILGMTLGGGPDGPIFQAHTAWTF